MIRAKKETDKSLIKNNSGGTSLVVQWLRLHTSTAGGTGSIPGLGTKIPRPKKTNQNQN